MRVSSFRRSRFCAYGTWSTFRCPSVPSQGHSLPHAGESVRLAASLLACYHARIIDVGFQHHHLMEGMMDVGFITRELRFDSPSLTLRTELANLWHTSLLPNFAFTGMLLSPYGFPFQVSRCSEGHVLSTFPALRRNSICTEAAHDPDPHIGKGSDRHGVTFAFCALAVIIVSGPRFTLRRLPGELMQGIAQGFDTAQPSMGFGVDPALIQHGRGSTQRLQEAFILVARAIIPDFWKPSRSQALAGTWQALKDLMVLMGQKKGGNLLVVLSNLFNEWHQLTHQGYHQARFGAGDDGIGLQMRLLQAFNDLGGNCQGIGMTCFLEYLRELVCRGTLGGLRSWIGLQKHQGGVLLDLRKQLQRNGIVGFEASRELIHQTSLCLDQRILITGEQFELGHLLAIRGEAVQIGKVCSSRLGQQIRINRIRFGSRGRTPSINGPRVDRIHWPACFQQVRDQQPMRRLDDARHLLFGCRAEDLLQKGVQLAHPLRGVIDPQRTDLTPLLIDDQSVMIG